MTNPTGDQAQNETADHVGVLLRDALADTPYDAGPYVARAVAATRTRRRRSRAAAVALTAAAAAGLVTLAVYPGHDTGRAARLTVATAPPTASAPGGGPWIVTQEQADNSPHAVTSVPSSEPPVNQATVAPTSPPVTAMRRSFGLGSNFKVTGGGTVGVRTGSAITVLFSDPAGDQVMVSEQTLDQPVPAPSVVDTTAAWALRHDAAGNSYAVSQSTGNIQMAVATATGTFARIEEHGPRTATQNLNSILAQLEHYLGLHNGITTIRTSTPPASAAYPTPHYLPPGVTVAQPLTAGPTNSAVAGSDVESFALAGRANINTMPSDSALLIANPGGYHPASHLTYTVSAGTSGGDPPDVQAQFFTVQKITISGHPGWSWVGVTHYGDEYVTWTDGRNSYELHCDHLQTVDGVSGVDMAQLIKMAQSVS